MTDADDFEDLQPAAKSAAMVEPVMIGVIKLRGGALRISFSLDGALARRVAGDGWPRFNIGFSQSQRRFRISGKVQGPFEAWVPPKGTRVTLRCPPPAIVGLPFREHEKIDPKWEEVGGALLVSIPAVLFEPIRAIAGPKPTAPSIAAAAAKAVPAPKF